MASIAEVRCPKCNQRLFIQLAGNLGTAICEACGVESIFVLRGEVAEGADVCEKRVPFCLDAIQLHSVFVAYTLLQNGSQLDFEAAPDVAVELVEGSCTFEGKLVRTNGDVAWICLSGSDEVFLEVSRDLVRLKE